MTITTAPEPPIVVNGTTLPATLAAVLRYLVAMAGASLVTSGTLRVDQIEGLVTVVITLATFGYGIWRTNQKQGDLITAARSADDRVAVVK
jgi:hypothetical protein